jgi:hypothetical protein
MLLWPANPEVSVTEGRGMRRENDPRTPGAIGILIARMRRRTGRVGAAVALLSGVLAAVVVFAVVACRSVK